MNALCLYGYKYEIPRLFLVIVQYPVLSSMSFCSAPCLTTLIFVLVLALVTQVIKH